MSGARQFVAFALLTVFALGSAGCYRGKARTVSLADLDREPGWLVVRDVPEVRQESDEDCGPAALAMVLAHWGIPNAAREIRQAVPSSEVGGVTAGALRQFTRTKGLSAFLISGRSADLEHELRARRPVLVGLVQRYTGGRALTHYEVVVGLNPATRRILLLDPGRGPREDELASFDDEWRASGRLALVVAKS
jgi:ABC-type bacteriocin/lantibiotic exporter with double-glycine peptidase domain